ncbi:MAG: hypothetical protein CM1200mP16_11660 [Nitrospina sp.]|nr:MAG: hypothetical protein CM1200mP16_11660 [Nitrospina sp.]
MILILFIMELMLKKKKGRKVKAVFEGTVLYTGELEGYGNLVIIGHGKGISLFIWALGYH